tara:strand:+ start:147 stop:698 length:552 start_codon:yes stop_codon:yes gene_type:complete
MQKKVLSQIDLYTGEITMPKGFEIDRTKIKNDILKSFITEDRISNNPQTYNYKNYKVPFSKPLHWMQDYMRDHWRAEYNYTLIPKDIHGKVLNPKEQSVLIHSVDPVDLRNSADYTLLYGVEVEPNSCECIIEYDDNRRKNRTWHIPIKNNHFIMFPATQRYMITENTSDKINTIVVINYEYI